MEAVAASAAGATYTSWTVEPRPISLPRERVKPSRARWATRSAGELVLSGGGAEHHDASAALQAAHERGEEALERDQVGRGLDAGGVEHQALVPLALGGVRDRGDAELVERGDHGGAEPSVAADHDRAVDEGGALGPPVQRHRVGQAEVLGEQLAHGGVDQGLVPIAHADCLLQVGAAAGPVLELRITCNYGCNSESTFRDVALTTFPSGARPRKDGRVRLARAGRRSRRPCAVHPSLDITRS